MAPPIIHKVVCPIPAAQWFMFDSRWGLGYV